VQLLRDEGPMTSQGLASALYDGGWRPATADTAEKRSAAISVICRNLVVKKLLRVKDPTTQPYVYEAV